MIEKKFIEVSTKIKRGWNKLSILDRRLIFIFLGLMVILFTSHLVINTYFSYVNGKIIDKEACINLGLETYNKMVVLPTWERIIYEYKPAFSLLLMAVFIGWILHGVGFRII